MKQGGETVARANWGTIVSKGSAAGPRTRIELIDQGKNWVNVTVVDDDTGQPVPCRIHFRSLDGVPYQPHGFHNHINSNLDTWHKDVGGDLRLGQITYAYIDGTCQGWLPRGEVIVDVARGFEYEPLRAKVQIQAGQRRSEPPTETLDEHERAAVVQRGLARPLSDAGRRAPRVAGRGPERGQPAPIAVGESVHQHGGLHGRAERLPRREATSSTSDRRTGSMPSDT